MQVYVLITDGFNVIIPKKAEENNLWQGKLLDNYSVVNQAGQYALFGGKVEEGKDLYSAAAEELFEESGIDINQYDYSTKKIQETQKYACLMYTVKNKEDFRAISNKISSNLRARRVQDGEMQSIVVTSLKNVSQYLGKRQLVSKRVQTKINNSIEENQYNKWRHSISWYREIANICDSGIVEIKDSTYMQPADIKSIKQNEPLTNPDITKSSDEDSREDRSSSSDSTKLSDNTTMEKLSFDEDSREDRSSSSDSTKLSDNTTIEKLSFDEDLREDRSSTPSSIESSNYETAEEYLSDEDLREGMRKSSNSFDSLDLARYSTPRMDRLRKPIEDITRKLAEFGILKSNQEKSHDKKPKSIIQTSKIKKKDGR